jgi:hypothetical protein
MGVVRILENETIHSQNTYPGTSVNPEQYKHHPCGHAVQVVNLEVNVQVDHETDTRVKDKPSHD